MLASALSIAESIQVDAGAIDVDLPYASLALLAAGRRDRIFYAIAAPDGSLITGYPGLTESVEAATSSSPRFVDSRFLGTPVRVAVLGHLLADAGGPWITVVVAHTRDERHALATEILTNAFVPVLLVVLVAAGLLSFGVRRALAPLLTIERLVGTRKPGDLSPIQAPAPAEVRQLLGGLNRFMERLQATLGLMQTFLADAAHQIRTPSPPCARRPIWPWRRESGHPAQLCPQDPSQRRLGEPGHQPIAQPHHGQPSRPSRGA